LWVITSRHRTWWRNVGAGAPVELRLHGHDLKAFAESVLDEPAVAARLVAYLRRVPTSARPLGVRMEKGVPDAADLARLARERLFVKVCLDS
jgi:hypothetical protein